MLNQINIWALFMCFAIKITKMKTPHKLFFIQVEKENISNY